MKIRVVGAGWYGCHLALALLDAGHQVEIHERAAAAFTGASGANQNRLHLGFHYPRDSFTRLTAIEGAAEFMARYPQMTRSVRSNVYAIAERDSLMDFGTYASVLAADGVPYLETDPRDWGLRHCEGAVLTSERVVAHEVAAHHFTTLLAGHFRFGVEVAADDLASKDWDVTIDCTYGGLGKVVPSWYEPCVMHLLHLGDDVVPSITVMDGPFWSLYQGTYGGDRLMTLTSVPETPLARYDCYADAAAHIRALSPTDLIRNREAMLERVEHHFPHIRGLGLFSTRRLCIRCKPVDASDTRSAFVQRHGNVITAAPGKINSIFHVERAVLRLLGDPVEDFDATYLHRCTPGTPLGRA